MLIAIYLILSLYLVVVADPLGKVTLIVALSFPLPVGRNEMRLPLQPFTFLSETEMDPSLGDFVTETLTCPVVQ